MPYSDNFVTCDLSLLKYSLWFHKLHNKHAIIENGNSWQKYLKSSCVGSL